MQSTTTTGKYDGLDTIVDFIYGYAPEQYWYMYQIHIQGELVTWTFDGDHPIKSFYVSLSLADEFRATYIAQREGSYRTEDFYTFLIAEMERQKLLADRLKKLKLLVS